MNQDGSPSTIAESIGDVACHWEHAGSSYGREFDAWCHYDISLQSILDSVKSSKVIRVDQLDRAAFCASMSGMFKEAAAESDPRFLARHDEYDTTRTQLGQITDLGIDIGPLETQIFDNLFDGDEIIQMVEAHLAACTAFLRSGEKDSFWPGQRAYAQQQVGDWDEAQDLEHIVTVAQSLDMVTMAADLREGKPPDARHEKSINLAIAKLGEVYLEYNFTGRAIALLSILTAQTITDDYLEKVAMKLVELREQWGEEFYQHEYSYALSQMRSNPDLKAKFEARLAPGATPLIHGAERHTKKIGESEFMTELYHTDAEIESVLTDGSTIILPYREHWARTLMDYRQPNEHAITEQRKAIEFEKLEEGAKKAIERKAANGGTVTTGELERLVCGLGYSLQTTDIRDDEWKIMGNPKGPYNGENISGLVTQAVEIEGSWLVTEYEGSYLAWEGYSMSDVAAIAPEGANAFWFSSDPLMVEPPHKGHFTDNTNRDMGGIKYLITPVIFYKVEKREVLRR